MSGQEPRSGVNVDEVVALGAAISAAIESDSARGNAHRQAAIHAGAAPRIVDVMSHSLGAVAISPDGSRYCNDIIIGRNQPIPTSASKPYVHSTMGGRNDTLEVYLTQGEATGRSTARSWVVMSSREFRPTDAEVTVDVAMSYDRDGVVQVRPPSATPGTV